MWIGLIAAAWAGSTALLEAHAVGTAAFTDSEGSPGVGGGIAVGVQAFGPLWMEGVVDAAWTPDSAPRVAIWPRLRVFAGPRGRDTRVSVSFAGGAGIQVSPGEPRGQFDLSTALDIRLAGDVAMRFEGGWLPTTTTLDVTRVALGFVWTPPGKAKPEPVAVGPQYVWLPFPACRWSGEEEANAYVRELVRGSGTSLSAHSAAASHPSAAAQPPGVVVSGPVGVDTQTLAVDASVVWARALPAPLVVHFAHNEAVLDAGAVAALTQMALSGEQGLLWHVTGSYSVDAAVEQNILLARSRATVVRDALLALGVPASQIAAVEVAVPDEALPAEEQRVATVTADLRGEE